MLKRRKAPTSSDEEQLSVSFSGRVRNKVSRPGTVDISKLREDFTEDKKETKIKREEAASPNEESGFRVKRKRRRPLKDFPDISDDVAKKKSKADDEDIKVCIFSINQNFI